MIDNLNNLSGIFYYIAKILSVTVFSGRLLNGIIFIYIGMKFSNNFVRPFIILVVEPILFSLSLNINCEKLETVFFRKASTVMYFMHMIFYFIYSVVIHNTIKYDGFESFIFVLICTLTLSIIVYKIEKKVI